MSGALQKVLRCGGRGSSCRESRQKCSSLTLRVFPEFSATMMEHRMRTTRRTFVRASLATAAAALLSISPRAQEGSPTRRLIPSTREAMPIVGLGTWITFNVGNDPGLRGECADVIAAFFEAGGRMIDSSPMYGSSQPVVGYGLRKLGDLTLFSRLKRSGRPRQQRARPRSSSRVASGACQSSTSFRFTISLPGKSICRRSSNEGGWSGALVGITTSEGRRHDLLEQIMRREPIDFVQFSYNVVDREAEKRLLPLASERGMP